MKHFFALLFAFQAFSGYALLSTQVTTRHATSPFFILDSNNPCNSGPRAAYIGIKVINNSTTDTLYNIYVKMDSISGNAGFRLLGPFDSTENIGRILPQDSGTAYFYVKYPCTHNLTAFYNFKIGNNIAGVVTFNTSLYTRSSISANAGGQLISQKIGYYDALGTVLSDTILYEFGNVQKDDEINIQPNGDTLFKAGYVRLLNATVISSDIPLAVPVGSKDKLYFISPTNVGGSGKQVRVVYFFLNHLYNDSTTFYPYAGLTSGGSNFKYTGNYGTTGVGTAGLKTTTASKKLRTTIRASCGICNPNDTVIYTLKVENLSTTYIQIDQIKNKLPTGYSFAGFASGGTIGTDNSSFFPLGGDTGTLYFKGYIPQNVFPFESYLISSGDSLVLKFKAKVRGISSNTIDNNIANPIIGPLLIDTVSATTCVGCGALPVSLINFNANKMGEFSQLSWTTASEVNNAFFNVYWSNDGQNYDFVEQVLGAGNSQQVNKYAVIDRIHRTGNRHYYKLEQVDYNGNSASFYAQLNSNDAFKVIAYPNPFINTIDLVMPTGHQFSTVSIKDITGKTVLEINEEQLMENYNLSINTKDWNGGIYFIYVIDSNGAATVLKVVKS